MKITAISNLGDSSIGQPITIVDVNLNGSTVGVTYVTSANVITTANSFLGFTIGTSATIVS